MQGDHMTATRRVTVRLHIPEFSKVGLRMENNTVLAVHPGSPAEVCGLRPGDVVESVDGNPVSRSFKTQHAIKERSTDTPILLVRREVDILQDDVEPPPPPPRASKRVKPEDHGDDELPLPEIQQELVLVLPPGVKAGMRVEKTEVLGVHPGSPAEKAGLMPGDVVTAIDGVQLSDDYGVVQAIGERETDHLLLLVRRGVGPLWTEVMRSASELRSSAEDSSAPTQPEVEDEGDGEDDEIDEEQACEGSEDDDSQPSEDDESAQFPHDEQTTSRQRADVESGNAAATSARSREQSEASSEEAFPDFADKFEGRGTGIQDPNAKPPPPPSMVMVELFVMLSEGKKVGLKLDRNLVTGVHPGSPAAIARIHVGDEIVAVEGRQLDDVLSAQQAILQRSSDQFTVLVQRPRRGKKHEEEVEPAKTEVKGDEAEKSAGATPPEDHEELCIELARDDAGELGMSLYGSGKLLAVRDTGAAKIAGLQVGDLIVEVDGEAVTKETPITTLMPASKNAFSLLIHRPLGSRTAAASIAGELMDGPSLDVTAIRGSVGGLMAQFVASAASNAANRLDQEHMEEANREQRRRAAFAASAASGGKIAKTKIADLMGGVLEDELMPGSTRAVVQIGTRAVQTRSIGVKANLASGEAIVRMHVASLSDSDLKFFNCASMDLGLAEKRVLGQIAVGTIMALNADVTNVQVGDVVVITQSDDAISPGGCQAGFMQVNDCATNLIIVPPSADIHVEDALIAADVLAAGMSLARMAVGSNSATSTDPVASRRCYAVIGCTPVGLMAIAAIRLLAGDEAIIYAVDDEPKRCALALRFEATKALPYAGIQAAIAETQDAQGVSGAVEGSGEAIAFEAAYSMLTVGGVIATMSNHSDHQVPLDIRKLCTKNVRLQFGCRQLAAKQLFTTALKLIRAKRFPILEVVSHRLSIDDAQRAYTIASNRPDECSMVVFYPSGHQPEGAARALFSSLD